MFMSSAYLMLYVFGCYVCIYSETQTIIIVIKEDRKDIYIQ